MNTNRLKIMRKVFGKNQSEISRVVNITQNAYSYWENGKVNIDSESLKKLANYYNVSLDFLSGRYFTLAKPVENWSKEQQAEYYTSDDYKKTYLEYLWGDPIFTDDSCDSTQNGKILQFESASTSAFLTSHETSVLNAYREQPHMQPAVDRLLGIDENGVYNVYEAAKSDDNHPPRIVRKEKDEWSIIENAPETDETLI